MDTEQAPGDRFTRGLFCIHEVLDRPADPRSFDLKVAGCFGFVHLERLIILSCRETHQKAQRKEGTKPTFLYILRSVF